MAIHGTSGASHRVITANPVNGTTFSQFILGLPFGNGTVVLLDNAAIHKTALVRAAAMVKGFTLLFMPPYSPEFNPIELVFGVIKKAFYAARYDHGPTYDLLRTVESASLHHSNARTIVGCFRHVNGIIRQAWHDYGV
jgi:transposase